MNCEWVQQNVTLYVYDELADDARHELEQHLNRCPNCTAELARDARVQAESWGISATGSEPEPADLGPHGPAGSAGRRAASERMAAIPVRPDRMAAPDEVLARACSRPAHCWIRRRHRNHVPDQF